MSGTVRMVLTILWLLALASGALAETAAAEEATIGWFGHTLHVDSVTLNPPHIVDSPSADGSVFCMVHLSCPDDPVAIRDLVEQLGLFALLDADGSVFSAIAYMPFAIVYSERNGVFATAGSQPAFDVFFRIPPGTDLAQLALRTDEGECWLADVGAENLITYE